MLSKTPQKKRRSMRDEERGKEEGETKEEKGK